MRFLSISSVFVYGLPLVLFNSADAHPASIHSHARQLVSDKLEMRQLSGRLHPPISFVDRAASSIKSTMGGVTSIARPTSVGPLSSSKPTTVGSRSTVRPTSIVPITSIVHATSTARVTTSGTRTAPPVSTSSSSAISPIHPISDTSKCLDVRGAVFANGTPVQIYDCNETNAQQWVISPGTTSLNVLGTNYCLDAGSDPASGVGMKIWTCFDGLAAQTWFYTADDRIAVLGQGQCLDLTNGVLTNSNQVQTWECTDNDINQAWVLD